MDRHKGKEGDNSEESMDQRKEEEDNSEESMDQRKGDEEENNSEEPTDQRKEEETSEEAMAASSLFAHPCSLLQYIARVCACCLGFRASFCDPKPSAATSNAPAPGNPSQEREDKKPSYFYMQEVITRVWAARRRPRPTPPGNPVEGSGGNGGQHN